MPVQAPAAQLPPEGAAAPEATNVSPEAALLLLASRPVLGPRELDALPRLLARPLDWDYLPWAADDHGVAPLLYAHLQRHALLAAIPEPARAEIERLAGATALRALKLRRELRAILDAASRTGLRPIVLKGAALAEPLYGDWALRPMADLDFLFHPDEIAGAEALLVSLGYRHDVPAGEAPRAAEIRRLWQSRHFHLVYTHPGKGTLVELHWGILPPSWDGLFTWPAAEVRERARYTYLSGCPARVLAPEDLLVHLALHHFSHGSTSLLGHCDVAAVVRASDGELSWDALARRARDANAARVVGHALWWVRRYLNAPVPEEAIADLCRGADRLGRRLARGGPVLHPSQTGNRWVILSRQLAFLPGLVWRLRFARQTFLPPPDFASLYTAGGAGWGRYFRYLLSPRRLLRAARALAQARRR